MSETFEFDVPATCSNLGPGYGVLGVALDLMAHVSVEAKDEGGHVVERRGTAHDLQLDARHDSILRGMSVTAARHEIKVPPHLHIVADSKIPPASGLGTQTAAVAAGIGVAVRFAKTTPEIHGLLSLLVELGGDPGHGAAALAGGLATACQTSRPSEPLAFRVVAHPLRHSWWFVIACPDVRVTTPDSRRVLPPTLPHAVAARSAGRLVGLLHALAEGDAENIAPFLFDEVHVPFRRRMVPGVDAALENARAAGFPATIAGHGPGVVALTTEPDKCSEIEKLLADTFTEAGQKVETLQLRAAAHGSLPI